VVVSRGLHLVGPAETFSAFADALSELDSGRSVALALVGERGIGNAVELLLDELGVAVRPPAVGHHAHLPFRCRRMIEARREPCCAVPSA
jgi:hypothetical protein